MRTRNWLSLLAAGGSLVALGSCAADFAYYAVDAFAEYLPDLLDAWLASSTT
jgi:hypothetical protein